MICCNTQTEVAKATTCSSGWNQIHLSLAGSKAQKLCITVCVCVWYRLICTGLEKWRNVLQSKVTKSRDFASSKEINLAALEGWTHHFNLCFVICMERCFKVPLVKLISLFTSIWATVDLCRDTYGMQIHRVFHRSTPTAWVTKETWHCQNKVWPTHLCCASRG